MKIEIRRVETVTEVERTMTLRIERRRGIAPDTCPVCGTQLTNSDDERAADADENADGAETKIKG